jgi:hypothetical protein
MDGGRAEGQKSVEARSSVTPASVEPRQVAAQLSGDLDHVAS